MVKEAAVPRVRLLLDYSTSNVTSGTWVLVGAVPVGTYTTAEIYDSSTQVMELKLDNAAGTGANTSLQGMWVIPGGNGRIPLRIDGGTSGWNLYVKAQSTSATAGKLVINLY